MIDSSDDIYHVEQELVQDMASNALLIARLKDNKGCSMIFMHSAPLIELAKSDKLSLLLNLNLKMFMTYEILFEATEKNALANGRMQNDEELRILNFVRENEKNGNLIVVSTFVCNAAENERLKDPCFNLKGTGEASANSLFLNRLNHGITGPTLLLYEDTDVEATSRNDDVYFLRKKGSAIIVEGNFDEFYQKHFRDKLEADLLSDKHDGGFLKPSDAKRMKVVNWKKSVKI